MSDTQQILDAIGELRGEIRNVMVKNGEQGVEIRNTKEDVDKLEANLGACFKRIEVHISEHVKWVIYTIALVGAILSAAVTLGKII